MKKNDNVSIGTSITNKLLYFTTLSCLYSYGMKAQIKPKDASHKALFDENKSKSEDASHNNSSSNSKKSKPDLSKGKKITSPATLTTKEATKKINSSLENLGFSFEKKADADYSGIETKELIKIFRKIKEFVRFYKILYKVDLKQFNIFNPFISAKEVAIKKKEKELIEAKSPEKKEIIELEDRKLDLGYKLMTFEKTQAMKECNDLKEQSLAQQEAKNALSINEEYNGVSTSDNSGSILAYCAKAEDNILSDLINRKLQVLVDCGLVASVEKYTHNMIYKVKERESQLNLREYLEQNMIDKIDNVFYEDKVIMEFALKCVETQIRTYAQLSEELTTGTSTRTKKVIYEETRTKKVIYEEIQTLCGERKEKFDQIYRIKEEDKLEANDIAYKQENEIEYNAMLIDTKYKEYVKLRVEHETAPDKAADEDALPLKYKQNIVVRVLTLNHSMSKISSGAMTTWKLTNKENIQYLTLGFDFVKLIGIVVYTVLIVIFTFTIHTIVKYIKGKNKVDEEDDDADEEENEEEDEK